MRQAFVNTLYKLTGKNKNILLLTGDLGFTVFEKYQQDYPENFFNMGVAEAGMMGTAAGLALSGKIPLVYSIAPFVTLRTYEQIRNDVCLHNANVKIVGVGGGLSYTHAGPTHHVLEDLAVMRALPNMVVVAPSDPVEVELALTAAVRHKGPVYIRLGKRGEPHVHKRRPSFSLGKGIVIKPGHDIYLITCGSIIETVMETAEILKKKGGSCGVVSMHTIKPLDTKLLSELSTKVKGLFTIEEHSVIGGLGSAVAEYLAQQKKKVIFKMFGVKDTFCLDIGDHQFLRNMYGLSAKKISHSILKALSHES